MDIEGRIDDEDLPGEVRARLQSVNRARILPAGMLKEKAFLLSRRQSNRNEDWRGWAVESLLRRGPVVVDEFPLEADARLVFRSVPVPDSSSCRRAARASRQTSSYSRKRQQPMTTISPRRCSLSEPARLRSEMRGYMFGPSDADVSAQPGGEVGAITSFAERILLRIQGAASIKSMGTDTS